MHELRANPGDCLVPNPEPHPVPQEMSGEDALAVLGNVVELTQLGAVPGLQMLYLSALQRSWLSLTRAHLVDVLRFCGSCLLLLLLLLYSRTGPRRALSFKLSDTRVYEPEKTNPSR